MNVPSTRDDVVSLLFRYLDPLRPHYSELGARLLLAGGGAQYEDEVIPMEAWARPLWGLVPFWAGGGHDEAFEGLYRRGLVAGCDPDSPEYWGTCRDHDQKFVEMAAIAYGLLLAPHVLWEPLGDRERELVAAWLSQVNDYEFPDGNWLFFQVVVNVALLRLGMPQGDAEVVHASLDRLEEFHLADGWYQDGPTGVPDYYVAFAFQFYSLLYARVAGDEDPTRAELFRERARAFAPQFASLFSERGEAVPYGRSMIYRFAQSAFWAGAAAFGADLGPVFPNARVKGLVLRNLAAWDPERTCDNGGVLTIGYRYPNLHMAEGYNAAGSPLWALKAFACLALPADDPFWTCEVAPLDEPDGLRVIAAGHQVVQREHGEATMYPDGDAPGHSFAQSTAKYGKFAYSSRFGFSVARGWRTVEEAAPDSMLAFVVEGHVYVREEPKMGGVARAETAAPALMSKWVPYPGIEVTTVIQPCEGGHVRTHLVLSTIACEAYDCGFAVPGDYHTMTLEQAHALCEVLPCKAPGARGGEPCLMHAEANTNISCGKTVIPAVRYAIPLGETRLVTKVTVR